MRKNRLDPFVRAVLGTARRRRLFGPRDLVLAAVYADEGPTLKRWKPRARGRVNRIFKRTCHLTVKLVAVERPARPQNQPKKESVPETAAPEAIATERGSAAPDDAPKKRAPRKKKEATV